jgi:hypothetical protein
MLNDEFDHRVSRIVRRGCARNACRDRATPSGLRVLYWCVARLPNTPLPYGAGGVPGFLNTASMAA